MPASQATLPFKVRTPRRFEDMRSVPCYIGDHDILRSHRHRAVRGTVCRQSVTRQQPDLHPTEPITGRLGLDPRRAPGQRDVLGLYRGRCLTPAVVQGLTSPYRQGTGRDSHPDRRDGLAVSAAQLSLGRPETVNPPLREYSCGTRLPVVSVHAHSVILRRS